MSILTRYAYKTVSGGMFDSRGFSFQSNTNPRKESLIGHIKMMDLIERHFKEHNLLSLIQSLEIDDDWSFSLSDDLAKEGEKLWKKLGLIEGLEEPEKSIVSYNYTMIAVYLVCNKKLTEMTYGGMLLEWAIYPIIRRSAYSEKMENPKKFWDFCGEWLHEHTDWIDSMNRPGVRIDAEAEACLVLSETIKTIIKQKDDEADN